jgi:hypothetical protein
VRACSAAQHRERTGMQLRVPQESRVARGVAKTGTEGSQQARISFTVGLAATNGGQLGTSGGLVSTQL